MQEEQLEELANGKAKVSDESSQLVCFKLANEEYALDIKLIQEVIKFVKVTSIPQMPDFCLGVINSRGSVIPLFDLRKKFHLSEKQLDENSRILVASVNGHMISMIVDEILDNIKINQSQIDPAPTVRMSIDKEYVKGLGELEKRMIVILDLEKMHEFILEEINEYADKLNK